jgi:hypothetical protein
LRGLYLAIPQIDSLTVLPNLHRAGSPFQTRGNWSSGMNSPIHLVVSESVAAGM